MNILMINPPDDNLIVEFSSEESESHEQIEAFVENEDIGRYPPLGLLYVASYLEKHAPGHNIKFLDCIAEQKSQEDLVAIFEDFKADVIGVTSFTLSLIDCQLVARLARKVNPNVHACLGGHHTIAFPLQAAKLKEFDSIVVGEGEIAFTELVKTLEKKGDITQIHGVYTSDSIEEKYSESINDNRFLPGVHVPPAYIDNLDDLAIPNRNFIKHIDYYNPVGIDTKFTTIITSRGCPFRCTYCDMPYKRFRKRSVDNVIEEIKHCLSLGYQEFHFYDDLFNIKDEWLIEFCEAIEKHELKFRWNFRTRVNLIHKESLARAKKVGLWNVGFGVETGTDEGLKLIKKGVNTEQITKAFTTCRDLGIKTIADFMIGFPHEKNEKDVIKSLDFLVKLNPDFAIFNILMLLPHTEIYDDAEKEGVVDYQRWIDFSLDPSPDFQIDLYTENMSRKTLVKLHRKAYRKFYFRPKRILSILLSLNSFGDFKKKLRAFFAILR